MNPEQSDVIILEADGLIDSSNGYGTPIFQALEDNGISASLVPIAHNTDVLQNLPKKPLILSGGMTEDNGGY